MHKSLQPPIRVLTRNESNAIDPDDLLQSTSYDEGKWMKSSFHSLGLSSAINNEARFSSRQHQNQLKIKEISENNQLKPPCVESLLSKSVYATSYQRDDEAEGESVHQDNSVSILTVVHNQ